MDDEIFWLSFDSYLVLLVFRLIGKALQDDRLMDLPLALPLCKILLDRPLHISDVMHMEPAFGRSLLELQAIAEKGGGVEERKIAEGLELDFTLPGHPW